MPALKIGLQLRSLRQPFKLALATAARIGATAVEIDARAELRPQELSQTGLRQVRKLLDDLRLRVSAVEFRTRHGYDVEEQLDRRIAATKDAMRMAHALGAGVVINAIGRVPAESQGPAWDLLVAALTDLGRFGQHHGALLAADTGLESAGDLQRLIAALPAGSLGIQLNPANLVLHGFSPRELVEQLGDHVLHAHANDAVRDRLPGRGMEVALGRGSAEIEAVLGALEEHGYLGYITVARQHADDPELECKQAIAWLRNL